MSARGKAVRAALAALGAVAVGALGWLAYWTIYDPPVRVDAPLEARFGHQSSSTSTVLFLGDTAPADAARPTIARRGYAYPFEATADILRGCDAVVANLESPVTSRTERNPRRPKRYSYKADPGALEALVAAGVDGVTLGNNHALDYGAAGLADTLRHLDDAGLMRAGAGLSEAEARRGFVIDTPGGRLGVLSYLENKHHWRLRDMAFALDTPLARSPGVARLRYRDLGRDIARMKGHADVVAVVAHWGSNYKGVSSTQRTLGAAAIDLGADVVVGHHSHQYQSVELYKRRPIVHSLGNYAFGTPGHYKMRFGMGAILHLERGRLGAIELFPLLTQNRIVEFRPRVPRGKRLDTFMRGLLEGSARLGAHLTRHGDRAWLRLPVEGSGNLL